MSVEHSSTVGNPISDDCPALNPQAIAVQLERAVRDFQAIIPRAVQNAESFDDAERTIRDALRQIGGQAMQLFVTLQGDGNLGKELATDQGETLRRSDQKRNVNIRSIFGLHVFQEYTYSRGKNKPVKLHPISARMQLPPGRWSFLLQEISQVFCAEAAYNQAADHLAIVLGGQFSVDTLERLNLETGVRAGEFLDNLPQPDQAKESKILVASADCKGVPLLKKNREKVKAFQTAKKRPGNRRMATVASVYSVEAHHRSAESMLDALFRREPCEEKVGDVAAKRPDPMFKHTTAHFPHVVVEQNEEEGCQDSTRISGIHAGMGWISEQVQSRRREGQTLVVLMDGQEALWDTSGMHFSDENTVEILDFLHVAVYIWEASGLFHQSSDEKEGYTYDRLGRLLAGDFKGVVRGLRRMGSLHKLEDKAAKDCARIAGYLEKHSARMKYDEYLAAGYPIASGVIEGACRHLVKDRMERSGMRWTLEGARSMLHVRAAFQSDYWSEFQTQYREQTTLATHPKQSLIAAYAPLTLAC